MRIKQLLKEHIIIHSMKKKNKKDPFVAEDAEHYQLPKEATKLDTNSYYFSAHDLNGNSVFLRRAERGDQSVEIWVAYKTKEAIYTNKKQVFDITNAPLSVQCVETAKTWKAHFKGDLFLAKINNQGIAKVSGQAVKSSIEMTFNATTDIFDFTYHLDPKLMAKALAKATWDKTFQKNMKENQQRHYEQQGHATFDIQIGELKETLNLTSMRDHSFGRRDWNYMNRHIWLMALMGESQSLNINMVNYPHMKGLKTGYYEEKGQNEQIEVFPQLEEIPVNGSVPKTLKYDIILQNGHAFHVEAVKELEIQFPFDEGNYTICEGIGTFDINGYPARGIIEFGFNKDKKRWNS